jgi:threonine dehydrogenase-like Zn-dependent dehydrogenase
MFSLSNGPKPNNFDLHPGDKYFKSITKTWHNAPYPQISPLRPELQVTDKVVFITGGGTGIGKATALAYAQAGAKCIAIFGRRVDKLSAAAEEIRKANPNGTTTVVYEGVDLSQRAAVDAAFPVLSRKQASLRSIFSSTMRVSCRRWGKSQVMVTRSTAGAWI